MVKNPIVCGSPLELTGDPEDLYFRDLPDGAPFADEVLELAARLQLPVDAVVADVGANIGVHALAFARMALGGHVHAFEPNPHTVAYLEANARANHAANVTVHPVALGASAGESAFYASREFAAGSMVIDDQAARMRTYLTSGKANGHGRGKLVTVPRTTVDDFVAEWSLPRLDLVKVDAEGFDVEVVRGAARTLATLRPVVLMEFSSYALTMHRKLLPGDVLDEVRAIFDRMLVVTPDGWVREIGSDQDACDLLYENATARPVQDLLCGFAGSPLLDRAVELAEREHRPPVGGPSELARTRTELARLRTALDAERENARLLRDALARSRPARWALPGS